MYHNTLSKVTTVLIHGFIAVLSSEKFPRKQVLCAYKLRLLFVMYSIKDKCSAHV